MLKRFGGFLLGVGLLSALIPKTSKKASQPKPSPAPKPASRPFYALVQTAPQALVLAISDSPSDLETEMAELNETWNRSDLRKQSHSYEIQRVCLLQTDRDQFPKVKVA
jgi:hypothetical protein